MQQSQSCSSLHITTCTYFTFTLLSTSMPSLYSTVTILLYIMIMHDKLITYCSHYWHTKYGQRNKESIMRMRITGRFEGLTCNDVCILPCQCTWSLKTDRRTTNILNNITRVAQIHWLPPPLKWENSFLNILEFLHFWGGIWFLIHFWAFQAISHTFRLDTVYYNHYNNIMTLWCLISPIGVAALQVTIN